jgi:hypothetical protein
LKKLKTQREFALDVITDEAEHFEFEITHLVIAAQAGEAYFIPVTNENVIADFKPCVGR